MNKINPMLLIDFYKAVHAEMLPQNMTKSVSYFTPRMSRIESEDKLVMFGLQAFIKSYLIDGFNEYFFKRPKEEILKEDNVLSEKEILDEEKKELITLED